MDQQKECLFDLKEDYEEKIYAATQANMVEGDAAQGAPQGSSSTHQDILRSLERSKSDLSHALSLEDGMNLPEDLTAIDELIERKNLEILKNLETSTKSSLTAIDPLIERKHPDASLRNLTLTLIPLS